MKTCFRQPCPVCGRPLNVPIELLGSEASCSHCSGVFTANGIETEERHQSAKFFGNRQRSEVDRGREIGVDLTRGNCIGLGVDGFSAMHAGFTGLKVVGATFCLAGHVMVSREKNRE